MPGRNTPRRIKTAERRAQAIRLRSAGHTWQQIADQCGYRSRGAAAQDVARTLQKRLEEQDAAVDQMREVELEHLDELRRAAMEVLYREHVLVSHGRVVYDLGPPRKDKEWDEAAVEKMLDDGPALAAIDRLIKIAERRAKLLGLDSPTKVEGSTTVRYEIPGIDPETLR